MLTHPPYNGEEIAVSPCSPFPSSSLAVRIERAGLSAGNRQWFLRHCIFQDPDPGMKCTKPPCVWVRTSRTFPNSPPAQSRGFEFCSPAGLSVQQVDPGPSDTREPGRSPAMQPVESPGRYRLYGYAFMPQQPGFALLSPGIAPDRSILSDNAMTGHHNRNRVVCIGTGCCPYGSRVPAFHCKTMI